ncbi:unnamed protein product [Parnassius mnemosyne]|uniref:Transposase n=2 Tax=Parnassius mnemosyne TaxID=213953 RepID=A0AAV1LS55_9NEOP
MRGIARGADHALARARLSTDSMNVEDELFADLESSDKFDPGSEEEDQSSEDGNDEQLQFSRLSAINIESNSPIRRPRSAPPHSTPDTSEDQLNLSQEDMYSIRPSVEGSISEWTEVGEMKNFTFTRLNEFYANPGIRPIDYFDYFFSENFLKMICEETNKQAVKLSAGVSQKSRISAWKELTVSEFKVFLGLLFHMGTIQLNRLQDYWKTGRLFSIPIFAEQMGRNRFLLIMRCLHFTSEADNGDPVQKVRSVVDYFNTKMNECYYPAKELSLDESMILWRGRLKFRQFIKNKRHKYGIKLYMLTEPDGLVLKFRVYAGGLDHEVSGKGHAEKVVMQLMNEKLHNGHALYMDNFYNSLGLAKKLLDNNTYCTGTLRINLKQNPQEVVQKNLKKGENISRYCQGVHIGKWKDKRPVTYITTEFEDKMLPITNKRGQVAQKPEAIAKYNDYMSGVDRQDQLLAFYPCERKTLRWYLKVAIHTFQLLLINSFKIYNKYSGQPKMTLYDYRLSVISALLPDKHVKTNPGPVKRQVPMPHKISKITERNAKGKLKRKQCRQCTKEKKRTDTIWHCITCIEKPGLCVECFEVYHSSI